MTGRVGFASTMGRQGDPTEAIQHSLVGLGAPANGSQRCPNPGLPYFKSGLGTLAISSVFDHDTVVRAVPGSAAYAIAKLCSGCVYTSQLRAKANAVLLAFAKYYMTTL
jgi:hypothetical protein